MLEEIGKIELLAANAHVITLGLFTGLMFVLFYLIEEPAHKLGKRVVSSMGKGKTVVKNAE